LWPAVNDHALQEEEPWRGAQYDCGRGVVCGRALSAGSFFKDRENNMTEIVFIKPDGSRVNIDAKDGDSVMQIAVAQAVDEIVAECGGAMMCATCHVYIDDQRVPVRSEAEEEMLEVVSAPYTEYSRLSCQVKIAPELEGLVITLPESQI
jgi:2Fe-2S ferredoxin